MMYRDDFDATDAATTFTRLSESRDELREKDEFVPYGYVPYIGEGVSQSEPSHITEYIDKLTGSDNQGFILNLMVRRI